MQTETDAAQAARRDEAPHPTKRTIGTLMTLVGRGILGRNRKRAALLRRIAKHKKKATELQEEAKELNEACIAELSVHADEIADFCLANWEDVVSKGSRMVRFGTGEFRLRDVGRPTISVPDAEAFFREARRKGVARKVIRRLYEPDLEALRNDLELAKRMRTVQIAYTTKMEVRPRHTEERLESPKDERQWTIVEPKRKE